MNNRCLKLLITLGLVLCVLFSSAVLCFAETEESPENTEPTAPQQPAETTTKTSAPAQNKPVEETDGEFQWWWIPAALALVSSVAGLVIMIVVKRRSDNALF